MLMSTALLKAIVWIVSLFLAADLARTTDVLFITLSRQSGTRCQMNLEIPTVLMALNDSWKQFFWAVTSVTSALEFFQRDALYKSTFYLLARTVPSSLLMQHTGQALRCNSRPKFGKSPWIFYIHVHTKRKIAYHEETKSFQ